MFATARPLHILLILFALTSARASGVAAQDVMEIPPGMSPRPTPECGGAPMMAFWEAERIERLEGIAGAQVGRWVHDLEPRLVAASEAVERSWIQEVRARYDRCLQGQPLRGAVCVAAAAGRPELCEVEDDPYKRGMCRMVSLSALASATRDPAPCDLLDTPSQRDGCVYRATGLPRCTGEPARCALALWLSPGSCRIPGVLTSWVTALRFLCRWTLWAEAARGVAGCDEGLGQEWREGCRAVAARAPDACPPPGAHEAGLILDSGCRDAAVSGLISPEVLQIGEAAALSVTLFNPFQEAARCVLHLEARRGGATLRRVTSPAFALAGNTRAWRGETVPLDLWIESAEPTWTWSVHPDCTWPLHVLEGAGEAGPRAVATFDG